MPTPPNRQEPPPSPAASTAPGAPSEQHLPLALEAAHLGTWTFDVQAQAVAMDPRCRALLGGPSRAELDEAGLLTRVHPDDRVQMEAAWQAALSGASDLLNETYRIVLPDGSVRWLHTRGRVAFETIGGRQRPTEAAGVVMDLATRDAKVLDALTLERARLQVVVDQMPSGLSVAEAPSGRLLLHNDEAVRLLRHPLLASDSIEGYAQYGALHEDGTPYAPEEYPIARAARQGEVVHQETMHYRRGDGTRAVFSVNAAPVRDADGRIIFAVSTFHDISGRVTAESTLERTRAHFRRALHDSELVAARIDRDLRYVWIYNPHPDFEPDAVIGKRDDDLDSGPGIDALMDLKRDVIERGETVRREITFERSDGTHYYDIKGVPLRGADGAVTGLTTVSRDVTKRKESEQALRHLSHRLMQAQEEERRAIARELHDEIGALLTALQMSLKMIPASTDAAAREVEEANHLAQTIVDHVRQLSLDLRPSVLDDMGLAEALRLFVGRFDERTNITFDFRSELAPGERLPGTVETTAYRVVQEAVTNAVRHAGADRVQVLVHREDHHLALHVLDEGAGFDVEAALAGSSSTGLSSMEERTHLIGGSYEIHSEPGVGTRITVLLPLEPETSP